MSAQPQSHRVRVQKPVAPLRAVLQFGLATLVLSILMPLWGAASFRRLGIVQVRAVARKQGACEPKVNVEDVILLGICTTLTLLPVQHPSVADSRSPGGFQAIPRSPAVHRTGTQHPNHKHPALPFSPPLSSAPPALP